MRTELNAWMAGWACMVALSAHTGEPGKPEAPDNGLVVINKGITGVNSTSLRDAFERDVLNAKPDMVLIYIGINDSLNNGFFVPLDKYIENVNSMIERAQAAGIKPVVCTIHHLDLTKTNLFGRREPFPDETPGERVDRYNAAIRKLAADRKIPVADFEAATAKLKKEEFLSSDGCHLIPAGNQLLAKTFFGIIAPSLKGGEKIVCIGDSITFGYQNPGAGTSTGETYPAKLKQQPIPSKK